MVVADTGLLISCCQARLIRQIVLEGSSFENVRNGGREILLKIVSMLSNHFGHIRLARK